VRNCVFDEHAHICFKFYNPNFKNTLLVIESEVRNFVQKSEFTEDGVEEYTNCVRILQSEPVKTNF